MPHSKPLYSLNADVIQVSPLKPNIALPANAERGSLAPFRPRPQLDHLGAPVSVTENMTYGSSSAAVTPKSTHIYTTTSDDDLHACKREKANMRLLVFQYQYSYILEITSYQL